MTSWRLHRMVVPIGAAVLLAACGGGAGTDDRAAPLSYHLPSEPPEIPADELLDWAESRHPALFPPGARSVPYRHEGVDYTLRHYAGTGNYLAISSGGLVFGLGPFTGHVVTAFGRKSDYACLVALRYCTYPLASAR